jgi:hypothetical protein
MRRLLVATIVMLFVSPLVAADGETVKWIPAAASNPGLHGTQWTTTLWIASRVLDAPIEVHAAFLPEQTGTANPEEMVIEVPASSQVEIPDAVATLFGESRSGAIRLRCAHPFVAQSRTANDGGGVGSFGQGIPAIESGDGADGGSFFGVSNIPGSDGVRSNVGIVNIGDEEAKVLIAARDGETLDPLGSVFVDVGPNGWYQTNVFSLLGIDARTVELADVALWCPEAELIGYLSRVDNRSGDGTFVSPTREEYVRIVPREWNVEAILSYTGSTVIERFEYTVADGTAIITDPESGTTTGVLSLWSPMTFCARAIGERGPTEATLEIEIVRGPVGEPAAGGRIRFRWGGGGGVQPVDEEHCIELD